MQPSVFYQKCLDFINGPRREKTCLQGVANNKGADQPAHPQSDQRLCLFAYYKVSYLDLWSPAGKWLASWILLVMFIVFLLLFHMVSWFRCST